MATAMVAATSVAAMATDMATAMAAATAAATATASAMAAKGNDLNKAVRMKTAEEILRKLINSLPKCSEEGCSVFATYQTNWSSDQWCDRHRPCDKRYELRHTSALREATDFLERQNERKRPWLGSEPDGQYSVNVGEIFDLSAERIAYGSEKAMQAVMRLYALY